VVFVNSDPSPDQVLPQISGTRFGIGRGGPDLSRNTSTKRPMSPGAETVLAEGYSGRIHASFRRTVPQDSQSEGQSAPTFGDDYHGCLRVEVRRSADLLPARSTAGTSSIMADRGARNAPKSTQPGIGTWFSPATELPGRGFEPSVERDQNPLFLPG